MTVVGWTVDAFPVGCQIGCLYCHVLVSLVDPSQTKCMLDASYYIVSVAFLEE